jgi:hypothetical protein
MRHSRKIKTSRNGTRDPPFRKAIWRERGALFLLRTRFRSINLAPMPNAPLPLPQSQPFSSRRNGTMFKLLGVGALILLMLIPLRLSEEINDLHRDKAVDEPQ